ncbi:ammonium transporter Rh type B isoform X2 [Lathamus discolor]|uniref:ammonium transporter Rh type B isoform X2 n=1 Tax=Lathamus discolor TaxID=678569 RepID=UPI0032B7A574
MWGGFSCPTTCPSPAPGSGSPGSASSSKPSPSSSSLPLCASAPRAAPGSAPSPSTAAGESRIRDRSPPRIRLFWSSPPGASSCTAHPELGNEGLIPAFQGKGWKGFLDVHLQTLLGFGFLVAFLSRYGPGSMAISILVVAFAIQWALLLQGFLHQFRNGKIQMGAQSMIRADFGAAAALISIGAVLGRVNPVQTLLLTLLGVTLFTLNEYTLLSLLGVSDSGGSVTVHTFGAYFGLLVSRLLRQPHRDQREEQQDTGHQPDGFAVVGTISLWIFWPGFTSATTAHGSTEPWAVLNTYLSMAASTMATFVLSPVLYEQSTLRMAFQGLKAQEAPNPPSPSLMSSTIHSPAHILLHQVQIQDATMAGAAVMGMAGEMLVTPFGALIAGVLAGLIPPLGFRFLTVSTEDTGARAGTQHPAAESRLFPVLSAALPAFQAPNPGHLWGSQRPWAARGAGCLAGHAAGSSGHCGCLRWQAGARVSAAGPGRPDPHGAGSAPAQRPAPLAAPGSARGLPHGSRPAGERAEKRPGHPVPAGHGGG